MADAIINTSWRPIGVEVIGCDRGWFSMIGLIVPIGGVLRWIICVCRCRFWGSITIWRLSCLLLLPPGRCWIGWSHRGLLLIFLFIRGWAWSRWRWGWGPDLQIIGIWSIVVEAVPAPIFVCMRQKPSIELPVSIWPLIYTSCSRCCGGRSSKLISAPLCSENSQFYDKFSFTWLPPSSSKLFFISLTTTVSGWLFW